jgi:hypothetical protein
MPNLVGLTALLYITIYNNIESHTMWKGDKTLLSSDTLNKRLIMIMATEVDFSHLALGHCVEIKSAK